MWTPIRVDGHDGEAIDDVLVEREVRHRVALLREELQHNGSRNGIAYKFNAAMQREYECAR